ncbi:hypothetical protein [Streptomyces zhaozhouensis]|nr:hypothetical protein [Streptomyces zhaozhouensis]
MAQMLKLSGETKDMTLDEIARFVELARSVDTPGDRPVYAELSSSGKIKQLEVSVGERADRY